MADVCFSICLLSAAFLYMSDALWMSLLFNLRTEQTIVFVSYVKSCRSVVLFVLE